MSILHYILIAWVFVLCCVYGHCFYDIKGRHINLNEKMTKIRDTFTEEE